MKPEKNRKLKHRAQFWAFAEICFGLDKWRRNGTATPKKWRLDRLRSVRVLVTSERDLLIWRRRNDRRHWHGNKQFKHPISSPRRGLY
jgi:hypothetical protein